MLRLIDEIEAVNLAVGAFAVKVHVEAVSDVAAVEGDDDNLQAAVGQLADFEVAPDGGIVAHVLHHIQLKARVLVERDFGDQGFLGEVRIIVIHNDFAALVGGNDELVVHNQSSLIHS